MSLTRFGAFGIFTVLVFGCDAGRAAYDEATLLEQQGKLADAMLKYDFVCTKAPDSKMCGPSRDRAGVVRVQLADIQMKDFQFTEAPLEGEIQLPELLQLRIFAHHQCPGKDAEDRQQADDRLADAVGDEEDLPDVERGKVRGEK